LTLARTSCDKLIIDCGSGDRKTSDSNAYTHRIMPVVSRPALGGDRIPNSAAARECERAIWSNVKLDACLGVILPQKVRHLDPPRSLLPIITYIIFEAFEKDGFRGCPCCCD
jgi:hypothetical protein